MLAGQLQLLFHRISWICLRNLSFLSRSLESKTTQPYYMQKQIQRSARSAITGQKSPSVVKETASHRADGDLRRPKVTPAIGRVIYRPSAAPGLSGPAAHSCPSCHRSICQLGRTRGQSPSRNIHAMFSLRVASACTQSTVRAHFALSFAKRPRQHQTNPLAETASRAMLVNASTWAWHPVSVATGASHFQSQAYCGRMLADASRGGTSMAPWLNNIPLRLSPKLGSCGHTYDQSWSPASL